MRDKLAGLLLMALDAWLGCMPRRATPITAWIVLTLARPFIGRDLAQLRRNVQFVYGLPPATHFARLFERQVLRHQVTCMLETIQAIRTPEKLVITGFPELESEVARADAAGKGRIMITAHLGSWELCAHYGRKAGKVPLRVLAKPPLLPSARRQLDRWRARMGVQVLWTDRKTLLRDMLGALKAREALGFVMDQKPEGRQGPVVDFLGQPTEFVSGPATMAIRFGSPVIAIFCVREGPFRYRLVTQTVTLAGEAGTDEAALTGRFARSLEDVIRAYPEQWTWNYKRWRHVSVV